MWSVSGLKITANGMSSNPMMETSSGTRSPALLKRLYGSDRRDVVERKKRGKAVFPRKQLLCGGISQLRCCQIGLELHCQLWPDVYPQLFGDIANRHHRVFESELLLVPLKMRFRDVHLQKMRERQPLRPCGR